MQQFLCRIRFRSEVGCSDATCYCFSVLQARHAHTGDPSRWYAEDAVSESTNWSIRETPDFFSTLPIHHSKCKTPSSIHLTPSRIDRTEKEAASFTVGVIVCSDWACPRFRLLTSVSPSTSFNLKKVFHYLLLTLLRLPAVQQQLQYLPCRGTLLSDCTPLTLHF